MDVRVGGRDPHRPPGVGVHRADVDLVAVASTGRARRSGSRWAGREHDVRVRHLVVAADEAAGLEVVRRAGAAAKEQPLEADQRPGATRRAGAIDTGWRAGVLDVDLEVVLEVLADARQVGDDVDPDGLQQVGRRPTPDS